MARISRYSKKDFTSAVQLLSYDPSSGVTALVPGQTLIDFIGLPDFNEQLINRVQWFSTNEVAKTENLPEGRVIYTAGNTDVADGGGGHYIVVGSGEGSIVLDNGNELLLLPLGDLTGSDATNANVTTATDTQTVAEALDDRVVDVASVTALRALEPTRDKQQVNLLGHTIEGSGGGVFYHDQSDATTPDDNGTVIVTTGGARWKRKWAWAIVEVRPKATWFGLLGDYYLDDASVNPSPTDDSDAIIAAQDLQHGPVELPNAGIYITKKLQITTSTATQGGGLVGVQTGIFKKTGAPFDKYLGGTVLVYDGTEDGIIIDDAGEGMLYQDFSIRSVTPFFGWAFHNGAITGFGTTRSRYERINIYLTKYGFAHQRDIWVSARDINCFGVRYPYKWKQFTGTAPFTWNVTGTNGWYNNQITLENLHCSDHVLSDGTTTYSPEQGFEGIFSGAVINNLDTSQCTDFGWKIGDVNYNDAYGVVINNIYAEKTAPGTATASGIFDNQRGITVKNIDLTESDGGAGAFPVSAVLVRSGADVHVNGYRSYGNLSTFFSVTSNSKLRLDGRSQGTFATRFTTDSDSIVIDENELLQQQETDLVIADTESAQASDIFLRTDSFYRIYIRINANGTEKILSVAVRNTKVVDVGGDTESNMTITSVNTGSGFYHLEFTNVAGFAYSISILQVSAQFLSNK